jgi:hypothetical protein
LSYSSLEATKVVGRGGVVMERKKQLIKPLVYCAVVFITLGVAIANEILSRFGMDNNYILIFSMAFVVAAVLLSKNIVMLAIVFIGVFAINLPEATLIQYHLDRDVLLAIVCTTLLVPSVYQLVAN